MTPEEFHTRAAAAVATVEPDVASYGWLKENVARRRRARAWWAGGTAVALTAAVVVVTAFAVPRDDRALTPPATSQTPAPTTPAPTTQPTPAWMMVGDTRTGDVDGDGRPDSVALVEARSRLDPDWHFGVRVAFAAGGSTIAWNEPGAGLNDGQEIAGFADIDRDGRQEVVVVVGTGAAARYYQVATLVGDDLVWVRRGQHIATFEFFRGHSGWGCETTASNGPVVYQVTVEGGDTATAEGLRVEYTLHAGVLEDPLALPKSWRPRREQPPAGYETGVSCGDVAE